MDKIIKNKIDLENIIREITFKNTVLDFKWAFEIEDILVKKWDYIRNVLELENGRVPHRKGWLVNVTFERPDTITGEIGRGKGRQEVIWSDSTESSVVKTCWLLVELMVRHELMEGFNYKGRRIFNPHNTVNELIEIQDKHNV